MRTVTFQSILKAVLGRHGMDPFGDAVTHDTAQAVARQITDRAQTAWMMWPWPELMRTEERAYRQVWNATVQYRRISEDGLPDEVYYLPNQTYYKVNAAAVSDPPVGTLPTSGSYFTVLDPVTPFVARDQANQFPLGQTIGVYGSNPSLNGCCTESCLDFSPSEKGTKVYCGPSTTVFIQHQLGEPEYTMVPYIPTKQYAPGDRVFDTATGDCYLCIASNNNHIPTDTDFWALIPVPAMFSTYLKEGVYADSLLETFTSGEDQIRNARASAANTKADLAIEGLIDDLLEQGQQYHYLQSPRNCRSWWYDGMNWWSQSCGRMCHTEPWSGDIVHVLTGAISIYPPTTPALPPPQATMIYRPEINFLLTADGTPSLQGYPSENLAFDTLIKITIDAGEQSWRVDAGPKDIDDPGQISPDNYNVVSNNKHYTRVL